MRALALLVALTLAAPAQAFIAQNGFSVAPDTGGFAVRWQGGRTGSADFWCAAGDYAIRVLHLPPTQQVYRASEPPRRAAETIRFSLNPAAAASSSGLLVLGSDDAGIAATEAQSLCELLHRRK